MTGLFDSGLVSGFFCPLSKFALIPFLNTLVCVRVCVNIYMCIYISIGMQILHMEKDFKILCEI